LRFSKPIGVGSQPYRPAQSKKGEKMRDKIIEIILSIVLKYSDVEIPLAIVLGHHNDCSKDVKNSGKAADKIIAAIKSELIGKLPRLRFEDNANLQTIFDDYYTQITAIIQRVE
jgi:hypothetical protein